MSETAAPQNPFTTPRPWNTVAAGYADHIAGHLAKYAADALRLAAVQPGEAVVDIAAGPGTLTLQAARLTRVHALDFSAAMLAKLRERASPRELANIVTTEGDGQALPYPSAAFDVGFSMFGLFMFPDRAKGFSELARVLRPGGRAVVASWQPQETIPAFALFYKVLFELVPELRSARQGPLPLSDRDTFASEMAASGLQVELHEVTHALEAPSADALWTSFEQSHVGVASLRTSLAPAEYESLSRALRQRFVAGLDAGPQRVEMPAWFGLGRKPPR